MNGGAFGENFPYSNFHDLNTDWIINIAKNFLDQYTHIQEIIATGEESLQNLTTGGLEELQNKADALEALLQQWYDTHSEDIANQLSEALADLENWYTTHEGYLDQYLADSITAFNRAADQKAQQTIASIPDDYTTLANRVDNIDTELNYAPKQYVNLDNLTTGKYWKQDLTLGTATTFGYLPPFHIPAGVYTFRGMSSNFCWIQDDITQAITNIPRGEKRTLSAGTVYLSANMQTYPPAKWAFFNFNAENIPPSAELKYGVINDLQTEIDLSKANKQFLDSYTEGVYWSRPAGTSSSEGWYGYSSIDVKQGFYFSTGNTNFSWFVNTAGTTQYKFSDLMVKNQIFYIPEDGTVYVSSRSTNTVFANFVYAPVNNTIYGYVPDTIGRYDKITNIEKLSILDFNNFTRSGGNVTVSGNVFTCNADDCGVNSGEFSSTSNNVHVDYDLTFSGTASLRIYIKIFRNDQTMTYYKRYDSDGNGRVAGSFNFDAASFNVYENADHFQILIWSDTGSIITMNKLIVYEETGDVEQVKYYDKTLSVMLSKLSNAIEAVETQDLTPQLTLQSATGEKYGIILDSAGNIATFPYVPNKYAVLGNSITRGFHDPLLGDFGMASTGYDKDWVHTVNSAITEKNANATFNRYNSSPFEHCETIANARTQIATLTNQLDTTNDLILIQMGDNVNTDEKRETFATSFPELLYAVRNRCPKARIIVIGIWFNSPIVKEIMITNSQKYGAEFVDITTLRSTETEATVGATIYYSDGTTGTITSGQATHPGDTGMTAIGNAVVNKLNME